MNRLSRMVGDRYEPVEVAGRGAMGEVWTARDLRLDRPVAVKLLNPRIGCDAGMRQRFEREARAAARLNHPNVVSVYDSGEDEGQPFLVMELLSGRTLADELAVGPLDPQRARTVGVDVLAALSASHGAGILHRDIKPANVLLTADGRAKVADFGIAKSLEGGDLTATGMILGTFAYLAPERLAGRPATPQTDVYAVGAVLYEGLAGRRPFDADSRPAMLRAIDEGARVPLRRLRPTLDPTLLAVVDRALANNPGDRFPTAARMAQALQAAGASDDHPAGTTPMTAAADPTPTEVLTAPITGRTASGAPRGAMASGGPRPARARPWWRHRRAAAVLVASAAVLVTAVLARPSPPPDRDAPATTPDPATASSIPEALDDAIVELEGAVRP